MKKACVIGWPISHSRSPLIHGYWLKHFAIDGSYERLPVEPQDLAGFAHSLAKGAYVGCNVTLPHKEAMAKLVDHLDDRARRSASVNTVYVRDGKLHATSTDGLGFCHNVMSHAPAFKFSDAEIIVIGAGGSARAIIDEMLRQGVRKIRVANRTPDRAVELNAIFGETVEAIPLDGMRNFASSCDLLVNTTSLGMQGQPPLHLDLTPFPPATAVADIIYTPLKTGLIRQAEDRGHPVVPGLGMLLHQAVQGFELWFGKTPRVTPELYALVARDIDPGFGP